VENHEALMPLIRELPERERRILGLRFVHNMTQTQIAERIGVSQMHVSRLLARTLERLRDGLTGHEEE
jgi:RNA polymerase sigma-B factor